jgi:hypothetical protein
VAVAGAVGPVVPADADPAAGEALLGVRDVHGASQVLPDPVRASARVNKSQGAVAGVAAGSV